MKILVFVEHSHGKIKRSSIELLQFARKAGAETHALAMGPDAPSLAAEAGQNGAQNLHVFADASVKDYNSELYTKSISGLISEIKPRVILAAAGSLGRDLFPRIAAKLNLGIASDCVEIALTPQLSAKKPLYSGKCFAKVNFQGEDPHIVLMRPNQLPVEASSGAAAQVVNHTSPAATDLKTVLKEIVKGASEKLDLTEANIIVSGGRGLKDAANFKLLNDLAEVLGATVGASRAVVDAGWVPHQMQVGQTGKTVAPTLYIAVGISGAIQHLAGMSGSKVIVAINNDSNAPIFQKASYGIVGDALTILPLLTEEFRKVMKH
jgi:electron transfer flavoprotein alpha subunit